MIDDAVRALWYMLPAYVANPSAVIFKGKVPMDFGKKFIDGRRILGDGKTWRGFFGGIIGGCVIGLIQNILALFFPNDYFPTFYRTEVYENPLKVIGASMLIVFLLSLGSMTGDAAGSFVKRRMGLERGEKGFLLDQWPFVIVAFVFTFLAFRDFFIYAFWNLPSFSIIFFVTPLLHRAVNILGYKIGKKEVPW